MTRRTALTLSLGGTLCIARAATTQAPRVSVSRIPNGALQPQVVVDSEGVVHLLYYDGDPFQGDVYYTRSTDGGAAFSKALQVNSTPGSAIAAGTIRGPQLAIGKNRRVHVSWNGSSASKLQGPVNPDSGKPGAPMLYSRLNNAGAAFEPERNLMHRSFGLDGGGTIAADPRGHVYVLWHGILTDLKSGAGAEGEARRQVWISRSDDEGKTFPTEKPAWNEATGACACCGMKAFTSEDGSLYALYRSATQAVHRDIYLLSSKDQGKSFQGALVHKWNINACPMSSMDFAEGPQGVLAAWETGGEVFWKPLAGKTPEAPTKAPAGKGQKHPRLAVNKTGDVLFVWTEGTGWKKGGSLVYQLYDQTGKPIEEKGTVSGVPAWSFAAPLAKADGSFTILY